MSTQLGYPKSIWYIFGNELCERFSYHGLKAILVLFFTTIQKYDHDTSTVLFHMYLVCAYLAPFLGAIVADSCWGKYKTIFILSVIHAIGNVVVAVASLITSVSLRFQRLFTIIGLLLTSIGAGGIKPCVASFGGDQFVLPEQAHHLQMFFSIFYFTINAGSLLSTFVTPELKKSVHCFGKDSCFPLAFGVPALLMMISLTFFVCGKSLYKIKKPMSSVISTSIGCIFCAIKKKITASSNDPKRKDWLEYADNKYNKHEISELRSALDIMYLFIPLPLFYTLFDQQGSRWTLQAMLMNGKIDFFNFTIKPDQVHFINPLGLLIFIPLFNVIVYPLLYKLGINTPLRKITLGGMLVACAFVCAAVVQYIITGESITLSSNEGHLRIYNNFDCKVAVSDSSIGNFSIEPFDVFHTNYNPILHETDIISINIDPTCQFHTNTSINRHISVVKEKMSSYLLTYSNGKGLGVKYLNKFNKLRNRNPNLRVLHDDNLFGKHITLRDIHNKLSKISIRLSSNRDKNYEVPVGTYHIYLDDYYISEAALLPASINDLLFHQQFNHINFKLITLEKGRYIHIIWQLPQMILTTMGEVMFVVTLMEFSFTQAPLSMKSFLSSVNMSTRSVGNLLIVIISKMRLFENQGHEYLFYATLMFLTMLLFMLMTSKYEYKCVTDNQPEE